jgi:hypothetical protein
LKTDIRTVDRDELVDISTVRIDPSLPQEQRIKDYIRQVKNPYCYLDNGVVVHISFADTDATLEDQLLSYLKRMT